MNKLTEIKSYKDCNGNTVKIGDEIEEVRFDDTLYAGQVVKIWKNGFYVHPETHLSKRKDQFWGKFTRKIE